MSYEISEIISRQDLEKAVQFIHANNPPFKPIEPGADGSPNEPAVPGCTNPEACNYCSTCTETDNEMCFYPDEQCDCSAPYWSESCQYCTTVADEECIYCDDPNATNFGELGECYYHGCTDPNSCNYNPYATPGNPQAEECELPIEGCECAEDSDGWTLLPLWCGDCDAARADILAGGTGANFVWPGGATCACGDTYPEVIIQQGYCDCIGTEQSPYCDCDGNPLDPYCDCEGNTSAFGPQTCSAYRA